MFSSNQSYFSWLFFGLTLFSYEPMGSHTWLALSHMGVTNNINHGTWVEWFFFLGQIVTTIKLLATLLGAHNF
jgi:hypothetical protein